MRCCSPSSSSNPTTSQKGRPNASARRRDRIRNYPWRGNVRELKNEMQRAFIMYDGVIDLAELAGGNPAVSQAPGTGGSLEQSERSSSSPR